MELIVPHPRMNERRFVLAPLAEIAPLAVHPVLQSTAKDLLARLDQAERPVESRRELQGQNAVITGSTSGIGRAIALELAGGRERVDPWPALASSAAQVAEECRQRQATASTLLADLREPWRIAAFFEQCRLRFSAIDIWINNACADTLTGEGGEVAVRGKAQELWRWTCCATIQLSRAIGALMKEARCHPQRRLGSGGNRHGRGQRPALRHNQGRRVTRRSAAAWR